MSKMINRRSTIREMTATVPNPNSDRRKKYGEAAIAAVQVGARLVVHEWEEALGPGGALIPQGYINVSVEGRAFTIERRAFKELLIEHSREAPARTYREFAKLHDQDSAWASNKILQTLWENPITRPEVEAAMFDLVKNDLVEEA